MPARPPAFRNRLYRSLTLAALLLSVAAGAAADGPRWWLGFADNPGDALRLSLQVDARQPTSLRLRCPALQLDQRIAVEPGQTTVVELPVAAQMLPGPPAAHGIEVTLDGDAVAADTVSLRGLNHRPNSSDAFLVLPEAALGRHYRLLGYPGLRGTPSSQALVVATRDGTTVHVEATPQCPETRTTLAAGDAWLYACTDISGARLTASAAVAVFGGARCAEVPAGAEFCSHLVDQLPPLEAWGLSFVALPSAGRAGDRLRVLADRDDTEVRINGKRVAMLAAGAFHEQALTEPALIETAAPALVGQYATGSSVDRRDGDPFFALVAATSQYAQLHLVGPPVLAAEPDDATAGPAFDRHHLTVVAPADGVGGVRLDGQPLPAARFRPVGDGRWKAAQIELAPGPHRVDSERPVGSLLHGFGANDGYGLPGALALPASGGAEVR